MEEAVAILCEKCGAAGAAMVWISAKSGMPLCSKCRLEWEDFLVGLKVAQKLAGIAPVSVRLPSGKLYRLQGGNR